jgi:hypothetical protein
MRIRYTKFSLAAMLVASVAAPVAAQSMDHSRHLASGTVPTSPGQSAYGAIAEIVRMLEADSTTDWSKVNMEALRQHLIDMDDVTLRADVAQHDVPGGISADVTGTGRTVGAIQRIAVNHTRVLASSPEYDARAERIANGARIVITAKRPDDAKLVARIRGLGWAGLMTEGDHHAPHHLALARGESVHER